MLRQALRQVRPRVAAAACVHAPVAHMLLPCHQPPIGSCAPDRITCTQKDQRHSNHTPTHAHVMTRGFRDRNRACDSLREAHAKTRRPKLKPRQRAVPGQLDPESRHASWSVSSSLTWCELHQIFVPSSSSIRRSLLKPRVRISAPGVPSSTSSSCVPPASSRRTIQ